MKFVFSIVALLALTVVADAQCSAARSGCSGRGLFARRNTVVMGMPSSVLTRTTVTTTTTINCASSMSAGCSAARVRVPRRSVVMIQSGCSSAPQAIAPPKK